MKVLLTVHQFFPDFSAGTEVLALSVARELVSRGNDVRVLCGFPSQRGAMPDEERFDEYEFDGIHVYRFHHAYVPMGGQTSKIAIGFDNDLAADYFSRILTGFRPDIVHFFHLNRLGTGLVDRAVGAGVPAFFTPTDFWTICPTGQLLYCNREACGGPAPRAGNCVQHFAWNELGGRAGQLLARLPKWMGEVAVMAAKIGPVSKHPLAEEVRVMSGRLGLNVDRLNRLNRIVAPNRMMEALLVAHGINRDAIVVAPYGVDTGNETLGQARIPSREGKLRIGFIGSLVEHKGCHVLLSAFSRLPAGVASLQIYGRETDSPPYAARLRSLANDCVDVEFRGVFPNARIEEVMGGMDVLVIPSVWNENTPLVLYSARAVRCPVLVSDVPGMAEVIRDGIDGVLFRPGCVDGLSAQILRLANDRDLLIRMSDAAVPPKSVSEYVDELMVIWQDQPRRGLDYAGS
jgi:glycosyltransferase involved in cell wall biosynthesis